MTQLSRRNSLKKILLSGMAAGTLPLSASAIEEMKAATPLKGNVNHAVCHWPFNPMTIEQLCVGIKKIGFNAIDLIGPNNWKILQANGVECSMCNGADMGIVQGFNDKQYHEQLIKGYTEVIPLVAKNGYKNLIAFSGNRKGMDEETGLKNCAEGLKKIMALAEKNNVMVIMELLNSKVDHKDYMCDNSAWGIELVKMVGSPNFKLLYDIYHMQIMEGDIIRTIKRDHQYFGHYHTAGNPGRNEIDETQELNYPAIVRAILDTGYKGYFCQEFVPKNPDKMASLEKAVLLCDL
jgi:hydroxypyruvate isomerase